MRSTARWTTSRGADFPSTSAAWRGQETGPDGGPDGAERMTLPARYRDEFIERLMETGNVSRSAAALGVNRLTAYRWRDDDPGFAHAWDLALEVARQGLRERVVETATALGLGEWALVLDPSTGAPELDGDFEPVTRFETAHVDARVLMKWMDQVLSDSPKRTDVRVGGAVTVLRDRLDLDGLSSEELTLLRRVTRRLGDAELRRDEAGAAIPAAILDGDEDSLAGLRGERREAATEAGDLAEAIDLAAERERRAEEAEAEAERARHAEAAGQIAASRLEVAEAVDAALAGYEAAGRELAAELRLSGRDDGNRVARNAAPNLRWACHQSALRCAELLGVPRAPAHRRESLAGLERTLQRSLGL